MYGYKCQYPPEGQRSSKSKKFTVDRRPGGGITLVAEVAAEAGENISPPADDHRSGGEGASSLSTLGMTPNGSSSTPPTQLGILDPLKSRYMSRHSAVAFPHSLTVELQSARRLPLHSFAHNCGVRPEEPGIPHDSLLSFISVEEINHFVQVYFAVVHPVFGILDQEHFNKRISDISKEDARNLIFEAIVAGVTVLGSFFSLSLGHPREADLVHHAKSILEDPSVTRVYTLDHVVASILRVIYLRATTRPHAAWMQSCTTLHLAESAGLHHERHAILLTTNNTSEQAAMDQELVEQTSRVFWYTWALHNTLSYEYGRSAIVLRSITRQVPPPESNTRFIQIAQLLPEEKATGTEESAVYEAQDRILAIPDSHPVICLTKANAVFCFYRRLHVSRSRIAKEFIEKLIELGNNALDAAHTLAQDARPWWQVLGVPFHYICILIAIDKSYSLTHMTRAIGILEKISRLLGTHLALEALSTAKMLMSDSSKKKKMELKLLDDAHEAVGMAVENTSQPEIQTEFNWDELFENEMYATFAIPADFDAYQET